MRCSLFSRHLTFFSPIVIIFSKVPQTLFRPEGYDHREVLFGVTPYYGSIAQSVYYADSKLCDPTVDARKGYPIRDKDDNGKMKPWPTPYILLVDRGSCSFVKKVRNAQQAGASAVIIADNACLCSDKDCVSENAGSGRSVCQPAAPVMADDGSGGDISIPSFLLFKPDADAIKDVLKSNRAVQVELSWALPQPDDRVEYDLWTTPTEPVSKYFQKMFKPAAEALGHHAYFTPPHVRLRRSQERLPGPRRGERVLQPVHQQREVLRHGP